MKTESNQKTILVHSIEKQFGENIKLTIEKITYPYSIEVLTCSTLESLKAHLEGRVDIDILMLEFQDGDKDEIEIIHQVRSTQPAHARIMVYSTNSQLIFSQQAELAKLVPQDRFIKGYGSDPHDGKNHFPGSESFFLAMIRDCLGAF